MEDYKTIRLWKTIEDFEDSFDEASIRACKLFVVSWGSDDFEWLEINPYTNRKAVIFSQIHFINEEEREGGSKDAEDLAEVLTDWGFKTQVCEDFSFDEIKKHLIAVSKDDHSGADCFFLSMMTHGMGNGKISAYDMTFDLEELYRPFYNCTSLHGKPKVFLIQACRGHQLDSGVITKMSDYVSVRFNRRIAMIDADNSARAQHEIAPITFKIPSRADFITLFAVPEGYAAFRSPECGSWLIQAFKNSLAEYKEEKKVEIYNLLQRVIGKVQEMETNCPGNLIYHDKKQTAIIESTLARGFLLEKLRWSSWSRKLYGKRLPPTNSQKLRKWLYRFKRCNIHVLFNIFLIIVIIILFIFLLRMKQQVLQN